MRVLLQNQYDDLLGGVETYFKLLIGALREEGHEAIVIYTKSGRKKTVEEKGYKVFYLPNLDLAEGVCCSGLRQREIKQDIDLLRSIAIREKPDIIHLHNTHYPSQYRFLVKYAPVIQTVHDFHNCCNTVLKMLPDHICDKPLGLDCFKNK